MCRYSLDSKLPKDSEKHRKSLSRPQSMMFESRAGSPPLSGPPTPSEETAAASPSPITPGISGRRGWNASLRDLPKISLKQFGTPSTVPSTPATEFGTDEYESGDEKKEKRRKRKKAEIWVSGNFAVNVRGPDTNTSTD